MNSDRLRALLNNQVYEAVGQLHHRLLAQFVEDGSVASKLNGAALALEVLDLLDVRLRARAELETEDDLCRWVRARGDLPRSTSVTGLHLIGRKEERVEQERLRWVGLAVIVALAFDVLWLRRRPKMEQTMEAKEPASPAPRAPTQPSARSVRCAAILPASKVRELGSDATAAGELLTRATYWWIGDASAWRAVAEVIGAATAPSTPADDEFLLVVFGIDGFTGGAPTSRPEGSMALRRAVLAGRVQVVGTLGVGKLDALEDAGFRR